MYKLEESYGKTLTIVIIYLWFIFIYFMDKWTVNWPEIKFNQDLSICLIIKFMMLLSSKNGRNYSKVKKNLSGKLETFFSTFDA